MEQCGNAPYSILPYSAGARVAAEGAGRMVGSVVATDDGLDYVVIKFDPAKVASVADFDGFAINGIGQAVRTEVRHPGLLLVGGLLNPNVGPWDSLQHTELSLQVRAFGRCWRPLT
jgi:hypothetical protein